MSAWARNRKLAIIGTLIAILILGVIGIYLLYIYQPPTCSDRIQNGLEDGIDCGGACELVCSFEATNPNVIWARAFEIADGVYNVVGMIENPNFDIAVETGYKFELYNDRNIRIQEISGTTTIAPTEKKPIFEASINTGFQNVNRVFLQTEGELRWTKQEQTNLPVTVASRKLTVQEQDSTLEVVLANNGITPVRDLEITALLYTADGNVYQTSKTYLEYIERDSQELIFFTWPEAFDQEVTTIEVLLGQIDII